MDTAPHLQAMRWGWGRQSRWAPACATARCVALLPSPALQLPPWPASHPPALPHACCLPRQVIAFLAGLHHSGLFRPSLIVCPATVLRQWLRELRSWWPLFRVALLHDSARSGAAGGGRPSRARIIRDIAQVGWGCRGLRVGRCVQQGRRLPARSALSHPQDPPCAMAPSINQPIHRPTSRSRSPASC